MVLEWLQIPDAIRKTLGFLNDRSRAYRLIFRSPSGAIVMDDLAKFCRATSPPWGATPEDTARYVGRLEVWHRIMQHLNLTPEELYNTFGGKYPIMKAEDDE